MVEKIVVPLDGSALAESILGHVQEAAPRLGAEVVLLRAIPGLTETMTGTHIALDVAKAAVEEDRAQATAYLRAVAERLRAAGARASIMVVEGPPAPAILHHLQGNTWVAMTTHGRSGLRRTLFGSVADQVVREAKRPVLLLRPDGPSEP